MGHFLPSFLGHPFSSHLPASPLLTYPQHFLIFVLSVARAGAPSSRAMGIDSCVHEQRFTGEVHLPGCVLHVPSACAGAL